MENNLVWMDLEMNGLDPTSCTILEIATIITDSDLNILAKGPCLVISQPLSLLENMDEWNTTHHRASGLWDKVLASKVSLLEAQQQTLDFIKKWTVPNKAPLAGNSIAQDQRFLFAHMPDIMEHLHYRLVDVSSIKELSNRWYPTLEKFPKKEAHRALDDIEESIEELKYYRSKVFLA